MAQITDHILVKETHLLLLVVCHVILALLWRVAEVQSPIVTLAEDFSSLVETMGSVRLSFNQACASPQAICFVSSFKNSGTD